jgi:hypothetical protein
MLFYVHFPLKYLEATQFFVWSCAPFLVALVSFTTFVLVDPVNNILDSQIAFVSLTLFNTLRGPLFLLPFGIASLIQGAVAIGRISKYLAQDEIDDTQVIRERERDREREREREREKERERDISLSLAGVLKLIQKPSGNTSAEVWQ